MARCWSSSESVGNTLAGWSCNTLGCRATRLNILSWHFWPVGNDGHTRSCSRGPLQKTCCLLMVRLLFSLHGLLFSQGSFSNTLRGWAPFRALFMVSM